MTRSVASFDWFIKGRIAQKASRLFAIPTIVALVVGLFAMGGALLASGMVAHGSHLRLASQQVLAISEAAGRVLHEVQSGGDAGNGEELAATLRDAQQSVVTLGAELGKADVSTPDEFTALQQRVDTLELAFARTGRANEDVGAKALAVQDQARKVRRIIDEHGSADAESQRGRIIDMLLFEAALMVLALYAFFKVQRAIRSQLVEPIVAARDGLAKLGEGSQDFEVIGEDRDDEIGDVARALSTLKVYSRQFAQMQKSRDGERVKQAELLRELAEQFEQTVGEVAGGVASASDQLQVTAASMAAAAGKSSQRTEEVTYNLNEASGSVTAAAAACDEFALSISEISRQAASSAELAREATLAASSADETISALTHSANEVGEIVALISSIAQRTNLLALNASIEAARGGEAGRGFAVVASEVKDLATQTAKATEEVSRQIRSMQDSTAASVEALRSIVVQIQELETTSISIAAAVDQQSLTGQDLARSIDLAARNTSEVTNNITEVRETAIETGSAANQVLASSKELERQAAVLRSQVDEFLSNVRAA